MEARLRRLAMHKMIPIVVLLALTAKRSDSQRQARPTRRLPEHRQPPRQQASGNDQLEVVQRPTLGTLKFPKLIP